MVIFTNGQKACHDSVVHMYSECCKFKEGPLWIECQSSCKVQKLFTQIMELTNTCNLLSVACYHDCNALVKIFFTFCLKAIEKVFVLSMSVN